MSDSSTGSSDPHANDPGGPPPPPPSTAQPPAPPPQGYVPPPQGYAPPHQGYAPPPQGYVPPPQGYAPPPQGYAPPPQGYMPGGPGGAGPGGQPSPLVAGTDYTGHFHPQEIQEAKALSVVGYLGILFLVPLLAQPNNRFARFHANQGLVLALFWFALSIARIIIDDVPVIGWFSWILWFVPFVLMILGMIAAGSGRAKTLPLVGNFQLIK